MRKANNLRRIYMVYTIIITELFVAAYIICAGYVPQIGGFLRILGYVAAGVVPIGIYLFYKWRTRDNEASSDEMEQLVLTKAFALCGLVAVSLLPVLLALAFVFPAGAGYIVFGYSIIIGGTLKVGVYIFNRKF